MKIQICFAVLQALSLARPHLVDVAAAAVQMEEDSLKVEDSHFLLRRSLLKKQLLPCVLVLKVGAFLDFGGNNKKSVKSWECEMQGEDALAGTFLKIKGIDDAQITEWKKSLTSGENTLFAPDAEIIDGQELVIPKNSKWFIAPRGPGTNNGQGNGNKNSRRMLAIGDRTVLAVSVVANDASTTSSIEQIANFTFGTGGDPVNLVSQYSACSYNKLRFVPTTDSRTTNGVYKVAINMSVIGVGDIPVENAIISALTTQFGVLSSKFNHVMICFPPGTSGSWIAYGYYNHYLTLFNDQMCNFVSVQMHEIGHNLNLDHSGEGGIEYADQSGMMGYSYLYSDIPIMCFNGAKSWQLGWYIDRQSIATPLTSQWQGQLVGISDYGISNISQAVLIKVETTTLDYYIGYNRKRGINSETQMGGNQVMITTRIPGTGAAPSSLIKMLSAGQDYVISNFNGSGKNVIIRVNSIDTTSVSTSAAAVADVMITTPTEQPSTAQPTAPTVSPTAQPISVPTVSPTAEPTAMPTVSPTAQPSTAAPTTAQPTAVLAISPTAQPTAGPTPNPTAKPTARPTTLAPIQSSCTCEAYTSSQRCRGGCGGNGVCNWISRTCKQVLAY